MTRTSVASILWLELLLAACGYRENGESCWSDDQCVSDNCWAGECQPGLLETIASWFESDRPRPPRAAPPPPPAARPPSPPPCVAMDETECRASGRCEWNAICFDITDDPAHPAAGIFACMQEYRATQRCPEGCTLFASCL